MERLWIVELEHTLKVIKTIIVILQTNQSPERLLFAQCHMAAQGRQKTFFVQALALLSDRVDFSLKC